MIRVVVDDLASFAADALVRPATTRLDPTAAALRRLGIVGGQEFQTRIRLSRELAAGAAVVPAAAGDLPAEVVTHAVIRSETEPVTRGNVARAWLSTLHQAQEWEFAHVSAAPRGTGARQSHARGFRRDHGDRPTRASRDRGVPRRRLVRGRAHRGSAAVRGRAPARRLMTRKSWGLAILAAWILSPGWLGKREVFRPTGARLAAAALAVPP